MSRVIVVTSGKGGVGKTTVCANLGLNLAKKNYRVCVVDMDIGLNNLDVVLGMEDRVLYSMQDVLDGKCRLKQALVQDNTYPFLYLLSSGNVAHNLAIRPEYIKAIIDDLKTTFDYILIDCPAGIDAGFNRAVICAEEAIIVTTPHLSSIRDADKVVTILGTYNLYNIKFVVNRARGDLIVDKLMLDVYEISKTLKIEFG
ncbi:MAG: septum site-determining protein MinD, partial [Clostridia bacterium]|nr:septum site-determining protein MinD [Clostridia bacterium]